MKWRAYADKSTEDFQYLYTADRRNAVFAYSQVFAAQEVRGWRVDVYEWLRAFTEVV